MFGCQGSVLHTHKHIATIFYLNDSDGNTVIYNEKFDVSRYACFSGKLVHGNGTKRNEHGEEKDTGNEHEIKKIKVKVH